ncbi:MAG: hypothetical protein MRY83_18070 [Flavobacteriales bacterium]|nr:hypothetical protein [Flavobacteriales bacterium]
MKRIWSISLLSILFWILSCHKDPGVSPLIPDAFQFGEPIVNNSALEGYTDQLSYAPGEIVYVLASSNVDSFITIGLRRYGLNQEFVFEEDSIPIMQQNYFTYSYSYGCHWDTIYSFKLPDSLTSGYFSIRLSGSQSNIDYLSFVIKSATPKEDILVISNTNTWQAYNDWGGASFYTHIHSEEIRNSVILSRHRPNKNDVPYGDKGHLLGPELHLVKWLESENLSYDLISDRDLHENEFLENYKLIILHVHPEYWTSEMIDKVAEFRNSGGNIMYLGGNGLYWSVALDTHQIECRKKGDSFTYADGTGGLWADKGKSPSKLVGSHYTTTGYGTYHPYKVFSPGHWVFEGTNLAAGEEFGQSSLNGGGASGHETDKMDSETPSEFILLAKGTNPDNGGAQMIIREETQTEGMVFSAGSISYTGALSTDSRIARITKNVIQRCIN